MFDLDIIERDWKTNSFRLSEEEIIEIYRSEGATLSKYYEEMDKYREHVNSCLPKVSAEERLLLLMFGEIGEINNLEEQRRKIIENTPIPKKKHLSKENQNKVIQGSLHLVFDSTRQWYDFFEGNLSMEKIYYICLEALINSVKYMVHCEKPVFNLYVLESIRRNITKYVAKVEHITYREAYKLIDDLSYYHCKLGFLVEENNKKWKFPSDSCKEEVEKPSKVYYRLRNEQYDIDYIRNISSGEFMKDYNQALEDFNDLSKMVMRLSFDSDGNRGLTSKEVGDYLGIDSKKVDTIRRGAIKKLRNDKRFNKYKC